MENLRDSAKMQWNLFSQHDVNRYFKFLRASSYFLCPQEALLLQDLINICFQQLNGLLSLSKNKRRNKLNQKKLEKQLTKEGFWFICKSEKLEKSMSWWTRQIQAKFLAKLKDKGWIDTKYVGVPPCRYVMINMEKFNQKIKEVEDSMLDLEN